MPKYTVQSRYKNPDDRIDRLKEKLAEQKRQLDLYELRYDVAAPMVRKMAQVEEAA